MTVAELSLCLLAMNTKTGMLEEDNIVTDLPDLAVLASGLLIVEPALKDAESTVVVSHRSVQDFLVSTNAGDFKVDRESTNAHISLVTLKFLILPDFSTVCESWEELNGRLSKFPFLDYAARFWPSHVMESGGMTPEALETMATLFMGSNFLPWLQVYKSNRSIPNHQTFHVDATPLYWAARLGLKELVVRMLSLGTQINESGGFFGTALTMAAYNGDVPMVKLLLANGADVNHRAGQYHTALQAAAFTGSEVIVNMLIDSGADVHARGGIFSTALIAAEKAGHQSIVKRLLDLGLEQPQRYETADKAEFLGTAILRRDVPAVRRIIEAGININDRLPGFSDWQKEEPESDHSHYPLILALSGGCLEIVKCIIDAGADLDVSDGYHGSALAYAAYRGQEDIVRALLDGGANPLPRTETYSGSSLPGYIKRIDAAEREKVGNGSKFYEVINMLTIGNR
jgi:ankyrin repeat protein